MANFVVDSKHGKRPLIEVPSVWPTENLAEVPTMYQSQYHGYDVPTYARVPSYPVSGASIPNHARDFYPNDVRYNMVWEYGNEISQQPYNNLVPPLRPDYSDVPHYQQASVPEDLARDRHSRLEPSVQQLLQNPSPKPKSAHYFYGPDGSLLPGPLGYFKSQEPRNNPVQNAQEGKNRPENAKCGDFLVEGVLQYGKLKTITVKNASPSFKTLPEFLIDELENHYNGIPETHVVLMAVNDNYSIYATPYVQSSRPTPNSRVSSTSQNARQ